MKREIELLHAILQEDEDKIIKLYDEGVNLETTGAHLYRFTPLMFAIECDKENIIQCLLKLGVDVNKHSHSRDKLTPLYLAVRHQVYDVKGQKWITNLNVIEMLLRNGANPNQAIKAGSTPLFEAVYSGNLEVIKKLIFYGSSVNIVDAIRNSPLDIAIQRHGEVSDITQYLTSIGAQKADKTLAPITNLHPKINADHLFANGKFLLEETVKQVTNHTAKERIIKKYDPRFTSLFRTVIRGQSNYSLYDKHAFLTTCSGCLNGIPKNVYLGQGAQAKVKIGQDLKTGEFVAIRITPEINHHEIAILKLLGHFRDLINVNNKFYIVEKLHHGISLSDFFEVKYQIDNSPEIIVIIIEQVIQQVNILHQHGYIHRDLAMNNFIINPKTLELNLIDFGFAIKIHPLWGGYTRDIIFKNSLGIAPELSNASFFGYPYSKQTDIFALGTILQQFITTCFITDLPQELYLLANTMLKLNSNERKDLSIHEKTVQELMSKLATQNTLEKNNKFSPIIL